ncbi:MAG: type II toxin-antitoxin system RelE/ParE family toxin [Bacteroidales bacterium]|nr:type II toxin-antitoxin system RelE/ParE family toxin [Bacteroidales bacterium]MBO5915926.1 type II toxin-antitoxin system RelE/ParE family toxin [Bacteroidales bacterium]
MRRELIYSTEYMEFADSLSENEQEKMLYAVAVLGTLKSLSTKFVKKLINTVFYELRVSVLDKELRVVLFPVDSENINMASQIVMLNGFVKKSTKDYEKEIRKAVKILKRVL